MDQRRNALQRVEEKVRLELAAQRHEALFRGFRTVSAVNAAEATVRAGWETLRITEAAVLLEAVTAYGDVVRDTAIVKLRENNVTVLTRDLRATQLPSNRRELCVHGRFAGL